MAMYNVLVYILAYIGLFATSFYIVSMIKHYKKIEPAPADDKTVTIIIPAYNEEKSIARTIKSALSVDYPRDNLEIIVVNDGSKDKTYEIAKRFESSKLPKVKILTKPNGGKGSALNLGIKKARGEIIFTMDADTFVMPDAVKKMVGFFHEKKVMAVTPAMGVYKPKSIWQRIQHIEYYIGIFLRKSFSTINAIHITPGAFSAYRKIFFLKHGGYDEKNITEDLEIALRIQSKDYIIENSPTAVVYTIAPKEFKSLMRQRRRWYTGLIKNFWNYRRLFGFKKGPLGMFVLPVAIMTIALSVILTIYLVIKTLSNIKDHLSLLNSINFQFNNLIELNSYIFENFLYSFFSNPLILITILFIFLLGFYLYFARKKMRYQESVKLNFVLFIILFTLLFTFWWIVSSFYILLNKRVVWR